MSVHPGWSDDEQERRVAMASLVYVTGLPHSGSTLITQLLAAHPSVLGLGEVWRFLSSEHLRRYLADWGHLEDARRCSCGREWEACEFWGTLISLSGLNASSPIESRYRAVLAHAAQVYGDQVVVLDSSKNLFFLQRLRLSGAVDDYSLKVLLAVKDVRGFVASSLRRTGKMSIVEVIRAYNLWTGETRRALAALSRGGDDATLVLYDLLCSNPTSEVRRLLEWLSIDRDVTLSPDHKRSHVVIGNRRFLERNREQIAYDDSWRRIWRIRVVHWLHGPGRKMNDELYAKTADGTKG